VAKQCLPLFFKDENGNEFIWNDLQSKYEPNTNCYKAIAVLLQTTKHIAKDIKYIQKALFGRTTTIPENNLLQYLRKTYNDKVDNAKELTS
jgi:hypothetical protein